MKLSPRESWLLAVLAPVLVLGAHFVWIAPPLEKRVATAEARLVQSRSSASAQPASAEETARLPELEQQLAEVQRARSEVESRLGALRERWSRAVDRPATTRELAALFTRCGMHLESSGAPGTDQVAPVLSPSLARLERGMREIGAEAPTLWRLELSGTFGSLLSSFREWSTASVFALPLSCTLAPHGRGGELDVVVWLWI